MFSNVVMIGRMKSCQICPHHNPKNGYVTLHGKNDLPYVITLRTLRWRDYPGLSEGRRVQFYHMNPLNWKTFLGCNDRKRCDDRSRAREMLWYWLWRWRKGTMDQGTQQPIKAGKIKKTNRFFPRTSRKECSPANTLILLCWIETPVGFLTYRTRR